jgi:hypothetical protein
MIKSSVIEGGLRLYEGRGAGLHFIFSPLGESVLGACEQLQAHAAGEEQMEHAVGMILGDGSAELGVDYPQCTEVVSNWVEELELEDVDAAPMDVIEIKVGKESVVVITVGVSNPTESVDTEWN